MTISFLKFNRSIVAVIIVTALFVFSLVLGLSQGKALAQASAVYGDAVEFKKGLGYFYNDQNRYPTEQEFSDVNILLTYFSRVPSSVSANSVCAQNFVYKRLTQNNYQLNFCLPANLTPYQKGWNLMQ